MSPVSLEPNKGVRLQLANYTRTRSFQGGGEFWETQFQQIIRQCLGDFLPRAEQDQPGSVLFQHFVGTEEVCSKSDALNGQVPAGELQRLERCIQTLKSKESDPHTDSNARKLIQAFKLPDPAKDPELYRVYGPIGNRKLLVLWGVEKESLTSLDPMTAVSRVRERSGGSGQLRWLWWLLALVLLFLAGYLLMKYLQRPQETTPPGQGHVVVVPVVGGNGRDGLDGRNSPDPRGTDHGVAMVPTTATPAPDPSRAGPAASPGPGAVATPERGPSSSPRTPLATSAGTPTPRGQATPASTPAPDGGRPSATPSTTPAPDASRPSATPAPDATRPASTPAATPNLNRTPGSATPVASPRSAAASATPPAATPAKPVPPSATPAPASQLTDTPPPTPTPPLTDAGPPATMEILNTSSDETPRDGKVKVGLKAQVHDGAGQLAKFGKITEWSIDGKPQLDPKGRHMVDPEFSAQLAPGAHRVEVSGTDADGKPVHAAAKIDVKIKSSVGISPAR